MLSTPAGASLREERPGRCAPTTYTLTVTRRLPGVSGAVLSTPASFGLDVPDDASFARHSPGRSLPLAPGAVVGATRPIAGRLAARGKTGSLRSHHWLMTDVSWEHDVTAGASQ